MGDIVAILRYNFSARPSQYFTASDMLETEFQKRLSSLTRRVETIRNLACAGDGSRTFDDCSRALMLIDDLCRETLSPTPTKTED